MLFGLFKKKRHKSPVRTTANDRPALSLLVIWASHTLNLDTYQTSVLIEDLELDPLSLETPLSVKDFAAVLNRAEEWFAD